MLIAVDIPHHKFDTYTELDNDILKLSLSCSLSV